MGDFLTYLRLTARVMIRDDAWLIGIPTLIVLVVGAWTLFFVEPQSWRPAIALSQAELFGPLMAAFIFAGLLDPEHRRGVGDIVFSKPHPPSLLLGVRMALALLASLALLVLLMIGYRLRFGEVPVVKALADAVPPCLFIGSVAVTAGHFARSAAAGYAVPLVFWLWDTSGGIVYNPLFVLPVGAMEASAPPGAPFLFSVAATKISMLLTAALLFWVNIRRLRHRAV